MLLDLPVGRSLVPEAQNTAGEFFGTQRMLDATRRWRPEGEGPVTEGLLTSVQEFAGEASQSDDITVLTLRYTPAARG